MSVRQWLPLIGITIGVFIFNMSEFMPIGLLTDIANDFKISESSAGLIISVYAWAVAIISLPMMLILRKMEFKKMLLLCVLVFAVFQFLSGMSSSYWMLMASRLGVAVAHAIFWSIASPLAVRVVHPDQKKLAISAVAAGTSIAMIVGLPLGRIIGLALGWRMSFILIGAVAIIALVYLAVVFPKLDNPGTFTLRRLPDLFRNKVLVGIYVFLAIFVTGYYTCYSYIEPFLGNVGLTESEITIALTVFGLAGIAGSMLFSRIYDRTRFRFITFAIVGCAVSMVLLLPSTGFVGAVMILCAFWGMCLTSFNVSFQNECLRASPSDATAISMSLFSGIFNVGIAMGSIVGGMVTDQSVTSVGFVGAAFAIAAIFFALLFLFPWMRAVDRDATPS